MKFSTTHLKLYFLFTILLSFELALAQLPEGFVARKLTADNIKECIAMAHAPDGRIFIAERGGLVKVYQNGVTSLLHTVATTTASEQGLLGIALHTNFAQNGKCYLYYSDPAITKHYLDVIVINITNQVTSLSRLMEFDPILKGYHNGGAMVFKNQYLYICIGESQEQAQAGLLNTYRGKVLRLLDDGQPAPGNPYYNTAGANRQQQSIWALGFRNPWTMSKDPQTQKLYVVDVGGSYEEVNDVTSPDPAKNYNYGWGADGKTGTQQPTTTIYPTFAYTDRDIWGCAITSGTAFNPVNTNYPTQYRNKFYFTDWCRGWLRSYDMNNPAGGYQEFFPAGFDRILGTSLGIDGNIYYSQYAGNGNIWKIEYTLNTIPVIINQPASKVVYEKDQVTFSVTATGTAPLSYKWQKNSQDIPGATLSSYTIASAAFSDAGTYKCIVTNSAGSTTSNGATLTVNAFNAAPIAHITSPALEYIWSVGTQINYTGTATDAEEGTLPASAYTWNVELFHQDCATCQHSHPGPNAPDGVTTGSFLADNGGESSSNIWFRLYLTVSDAAGRISKDSVDLYPNKVTVTVKSNHEGIKVILGNENVTTFSKTLVANALVTLQAVTPQTIGDSSYTFVNWSNGGTASQAIRIPNTNTTYTATYTASYIDNTNRALRKDVFASSLENAGTPASAAVDGIATSRWASAYSDPQWLYVDLGNSYNISSVKIKWENAFGKDYLIQTSNNVDANDWQTIKTVTGNITTDNNWTNLSGTGRYVRIYGTARATGYGYSIYELEVYGSLSGGNALPSVSITSPVNNQTFPAASTITINATAADSNGSIAKVEFFKDAEKIGEDTTSPYSITFTVTAAGTLSLTARAFDNNNAAQISNPITIIVGQTSEVNIALNKHASSSSNENAGMPASKAVDGNLTSRWSSAFSDPQWIQVNLGAIYSINRVMINWQNAKGKDYLVQTSNDSVNWTTIKSVSNNTTATNDLTGLTGSGKYIRVYGTARTTGYGYSIFEFQVYGSSGARRGDTEESNLISSTSLSLHPNPATHEISIKAKLKKSLYASILIMDGNGYVLWDGDYTIKNNTLDEKISISKLPAGQYILKLISPEGIFIEKFIKE